MHLLFNTQYHHICCFLLKTQLLLSCMNTTMSQNECQFLLSWWCLHFLDCFLLSWDQVLLFVKCIFHQKSYKIVTSPCIYQSLVWYLLSWLSSLLHVDCSHVLILCQTLMSSTIHSYSTSAFLISLINFLLKNILQHSKTKRHPKESIPAPMGCWI